MNSKPMCRMWGKEWRLMWGKRTLQMKSSHRATMRTLVLSIRHLKRRILSPPWQKGQRCFPPKHSHLSKAFWIVQYLELLSRLPLKTVFHLLTTALALPPPHSQAPLTPNLQLSCSLCTLTPAPRASLGLDLTWACHRKRWGVGKRKSDLTEITSLVYYILFSLQDSSFAFTSPFFNEKVLHLYFYPTIFYTILLKLKYQTMCIFFQKTTETKSASGKSQIKCL